MIEFNARSRNGYKTVIFEANKVFYEGSIGYPLNHCQEASRFMRRVFGLTEVAGTARGFDDFHTWNYCEMTGLYIDLTYGQFTQVKKGLVTQKASGLLVPNFSKTQEVRRLRETEFPVLDELIETFYYRWDAYIKKRV